MLRSVFLLSLMLTISLASATRGEPAPQNGSVDFIAHIRETPSLSRRIGLHKLTQEEMQSLNVYMNLVFTAGAKATSGKSLPTARPPADQKLNALDKMIEHRARTRLRAYQESRMNPNERRAYEFEVMLDKALRTLQREAAKIDIVVTVV